MELKLKYKVDEVDDLINKLSTEMDLAKADYIRKKKTKGEEVDYYKMINALNQRKKLKNLSKLCLAGVLSCGNILDKPEVNRAIEKLERDTVYAGKDNGGKHAKNKNTMV